MAINLAAVVKIYFEDTSFQDESRKIIAQRDASIPTFRKIVTEFADEVTDLRTFCQQIGTALRTEHNWGATGPGFLMELNKLARYRGAGVNVEEDFREKLKGLNAENI